MWRVATYSYKAPPGFARESWSIRKLKKHHMAYNDRFFAPTFADVFY